MVHSAPVSILRLLKKCRLRPAVLNRSTDNHKAGSLLSSLNTVATNITEPYMVSLGPSHSNPHVASATRSQPTRLVSFYKKSSTTSALTLVVTCLDYATSYSFS